MNKKITAIILATITLMFSSLPACTRGEGINTESEAETTLAEHIHTYGEWSTENRFSCTDKQIFFRKCFECGETEEELRDFTQPPPEERTVSLDGKKVMFVGNSFIYYGMCVVDGNQRKSDNGYFYQLCRANGEKTTVTSYVWGGKNLNYIYSTYMLPDGKSAFADYDYVFISEAGENNASLTNSIKNIISLFPEKTKFFYLCHQYTYSSNHTNIISALPKLQNMGVTIVDWGKLVYDVWTRKTEVPGATLKYTKESFVKNNKGVKNGPGPFKAGSDGDAHHPNPLSGYITALMAYSAVTGKSAVGQPYDFCNNTKLHSFFDFSSFISQHYNGNYSTNFDKAFASPADMTGFQQLIDSYNEKNNARPEKGDEINTHGDHKFDAVGEVILAGSGNTAAIAPAKCRYCGIEMTYDISNSTAQSRKNIMLVSPDDLKKAKLDSVKEYMLADKGNVFYQNFTGWGRMGFSSIQGMASLCDGSRECPKATDGSVLYWKIDDLNVRYDADGKKSPSGKYLSLIGYQFIERQSADGFAFFDSADSALISFDLLAGKRENGVISWTVIRSCENISSVAQQYGNETRFIFADFDKTDFDCIQIGITSASDTEIFISELEIYN